MAYKQNYADSKTNALIYVLFFTIIGLLLLYLIFIQHLQYYVSGHINVHYVQKPRVNRGALL